MALFGINIQKQMVDDFPLLFQSLKEFTKTLKNLQTEDFIELKLLLGKQVSKIYRKM